MPLLRLTDEYTDADLLALHGPVLPFLDPPPSVEAYLGLLTSPVGQYGRARYGTATAYTLRGNSDFIRRAENMFSSFGGGSIRGELAYHYATSLNLRPGVHPNTWFFCMPEHRFRSAIRMYLYGPLCQSARADWVDRHDGDGDFVGTDLVNDAELVHLSARLADSFYLHEVRPDYSVIPDGPDSPWVVPHEHSIMIGQSQKESQDWD